MKNIEKINSLINQAIIDGNVRLQAELCVIRDGLLNVPSKPSKNKVEKVNKPTVKHLWVEYTKKFNVNLSNPTPKEFGIFLEFHRNAGKLSAIPVQDCGKLLQGIASPWRSDYYTIKQAPLFIRQELKNAGLNPALFDNLLK